MSLPNGAGFRLGGGEKKLLDRIYGVLRDS